MTTNVYMGLDAGDADLVTPNAQQTSELHELGFTTHIGPTGWHAICESGRYKITVVPHARGWQVSNIRTTDGVVQMVRYRKDLTEAIGLAMGTALDVDLVHALSALIIAEVKAELRRAA